MIITSTELAQLAQLAQLVKLSKIKSADTFFNLVPNDIIQYTGLFIDNFHHIEWLNSVKECNDWIEKYKITISKDNKLECSNNLLIYLPSSIASLTNLQELWCYNNQLIELPSTISTLTKLQ